MIQAARRLCLRAVSYVVASELARIAVMLRPLRNVGARMAQISCREESNPSGRRCHACISIGVTRESDASGSAMLRA